MKSMTRILAVVAMAWMCGVGVAAAQTVVLSARGPSAGAYPQGSVLAPGRTIILKAGDRLEVLDAAGSHVLSGPLRLAAGAAAPGDKLALQDIFMRANASRPGIAAVRGFDLEAAPTESPPPTPPLWRLDIEAWHGAEPTDIRSFCIAEGTAPVLSRSSTSLAARLTISRTDGPEGRAAPWPAGVRDLAWPAGLPVTDGTEYSLSLDAQGATQVRWRTVPAGAGTLVGLARNLADRGCFDQLDALEAQVAVK